MTKTKSVSAQEERILDLHTRLESWNGFVRDLQVPAELVPALQTGRFELVKLARARPLTAAECQVMHDLIGTLLETNAVLREHAQAVSDLANNIGGNLTGAIRTVDRLMSLARFEPPVDHEEEE